MSKPNNMQTRTICSLWKQAQLLIHRSLLPLRLCSTVILPFKILLEIYDVRQEIDIKGVDLLDAEGKKFKKLDFT
jgi:hypothetical protein